MALNLELKDTFYLYVLSKQIRKIVCCNFFVIILFVIPCLIVAVQFWML